MIISDVVDLDDVAIFEVGVHTPSHYDLVLVYCRGSSFHDVKEHGSNQLPLLCHYVVSHTDLCDLPELGIETTQKVDETLVVGDCLLLYALQLQLVRALRFLKKDLIVVVEEVERLGTLRATFLKKEDGVGRRVWDSMTGGQIDGLFVIFLTPEDLNARNTAFIESRTTALLTQQIEPTHSESTRLL